MPITTIDLAQLSNVTGGQLVDTAWYGLPDTYWSLPAPMMVRPMMMPMMVPAMMVPPDPSWGDALLSEPQPESLFDCSIEYF